MVEEAGLVTLYNVTIQFILEGIALPDEITAIEQGLADYERGDIVYHEDLDLG